MMIYIYGHQIIVCVLYDEICTLENLCMCMRLYCIIAVQIQQKYDGKKKQKMKNKYQ